MKLIYHRGRHGRINDNLVLEENSLKAFDRAVKEGAWMIEFDVWTGLRVAHDPVLSSDLVAKDNSATMLKEVLDTIDGRCAINIEIKSPKAALEALDLVSEYLSLGKYQASQVVLSAFHHETVLLCKKKFPELKVGAIFEGILLNSYISKLADFGIDNLHLHWSSYCMDAEAGYSLREKAREHGMNLWAWTVNSVEVLSAMKDYGVDAVFTDTPDILI